MFYIKLELLRLLLLLLLLLWLLSFGIPGLVLPGRRTAWRKSGTSWEIRDGWQPYGGVILKVSGGIQLLTWTVP